MWVTSRESLKELKLQTLNPKVLGRAPGVSTKSTHVKFRFLDVETSVDRFGRMPSKDPNSSR